MNEYLPTVPFDLYELHLLHSVAERGSFTAAARDVGLTQSAITRQVQGVEARLGTALFERTTRKVELTRAGAFLLQNSARLLGDLDALLGQFRDQFTDAPKEVRVGVSTTVSMAYLPGFFAAQRRLRPDVRLRIVHQASAALLEKLEANVLDVAILCPPRRLSAGLRTYHRFEDAFDLIVPAHWDRPEEIFKQEKRWLRSLHAARWLLISEQTQTGVRLRSWLRKRKWPATEAMAADSFDLIVQLVALGQGLSWVPKRTLAMYGRMRGLRRVRVPEPFSRQLVALARTRPEPTPHVREFIENILF